MNLSDLDFSVGSVNPSGISDKLYYAMKSDIASWPSLVDDMASATETSGSDTDTYVDYNTSFTMATGKTFHRMYGTQGEGKVTSSSTGKTDCKMFTNKLEVKFPRLTRQARDFAKAAVNGDIVVIYKHDKKFFIIGQEDYRSDVTIEGNTGDSAGSDKGYTMTIEVPDTTSFPRYTGNLTLSDGTLNCSTGAFTASGD